MFKFFLYKFGQFVVSRLSAHRAYRFAEILSDIQYFLSFRDRKIVYENLKAVLGERDDLKSMTREVFRNFGRYLVEFFRMEKYVDKDFIRDHIDIQNIEHLDNALKEKKGAIIVTAHMGNWELGAVVLSVLGYKAVAIALPHLHRPVNDLFNHQREVKGIRVVPIKQAVRKCIEALKDNSLICIVGDRDFTAHGEQMEFLGRKAFIPKGPAIFSEKTGAPIVPVFLTRTGENKFAMRVYEPIHPPQVSGDTIESDVLQKIINTYLGIIEDEVKRNPTQWLMFRPYWRRPYETVHPYTSS